MIFNCFRLNWVMVLLLFVIYLYIIVSEGFDSELRMVVSNLVVLLVVMGFVIVIYDEYWVMIWVKY